MRLLTQVGDTGELAKRRAIFSKIPSQADLVSFRIEVSSMSAVGELDSIIMLGVIPDIGDVEGVNWENGEYLYYLLGGEQGELLLMRGDPQIGSRYVQLKEAVGQYGGVYQVALGFEDSLFSISINGNEQSLGDDPIQILSLDKNFWVGYELRDYGGINATISDICFESSSGDFNTCSGE